MIIYFSATGNTEFIARELAARTNDECVNLLERIRLQDFKPLHSERPFVLCAPVYVCEIPRFLMEYLKKVSFTGSRDVYLILTSGGYCGPSGILVKGIFRRKGMRWHGYAEFKMPRNYVAGEAYPLLDREQTEQRIREARKQLEQVAGDILAGRRLTARHVFLLETLITLPFNPLWCKHKLTARDFWVKDTCIGCGKCARLCPLNNIQIKEKKPVWSDHCTHCMACIGNCPVSAIEYGQITRDIEPYNFGKYKYVLKEE